LPDAPLLSSHPSTTGETVVVSAPMSATRPVVFPQAKHERTASLARNKAGDRNFSKTSSAYSCRSLFFVCVWWWGVGDVRDCDV